MNSGKVNSLQRDLSKYKIDLVQEKMDLIEPRSSEVKEIAESKIEQAYLQIQKPCIVIDAGFYIKSLNGFPRAYVNFALETIGLEGLLLLASGKSRECEFRDCLAYRDGELLKPEFFVSYVKGNLAEAQKGEMKDYLWSKLGLIFIPEGSNKTLAEMTLDEYSEWRKTYREKTSPGTLLYNWLKESGRVI